jgi:hypothetical protein
MGKGSSIGKDMDIVHITSPSTEFGGGNGVSSSNNGNGTMVA